MSFINQRIQRLSFFPIIQNMFTLKVTKAKKALPLVSKQTVAWKFIEAIKPLLKSAFLLD